MSGSIVLEVTDGLGYAAGRFALEAGSDGTARVTPADDKAELTLDIAALGRIYLGDETFDRLAAAGLVTEQRAGAPVRADRLFRTTTRPWCPDGF